MSQFHANGVVIRDVKPENFLFATAEADSHLKAIDFGIAQYCRCAMTCPPGIRCVVALADAVMRSQGVLRGAGFA